jgi:CheY-like chemotaxis protein
VQSGEGDPRHILIVEDDPNTAEMLSAYFVSLGYKVTHAAWGEDALKIASKTQPDLVVLDIHLPDIDGYEYVIVYVGNVVLNIPPSFFSRNVESGWTAYKVCH